MLELFHVDQLRAFSTQEWVEWYSRELHFFYFTKQQLFYLLEEIL